MRFSESKEWQEIYDLVVQLSPKAETGPYATNWYLSLDVVSAPSGRVYGLSIQDGEAPNSSPVEVTDENLLANLRNIKGQFVECGLPVFYHEYLMSTTNLHAYLKASGPRR